MKLTHQTLEEVLAELAYLNETADLWARHPKIMIDQNAGGDFEAGIRVDHWFSEGDRVIACDPEIGSGNEWLASVENIHRSPFVTVIDQDGDCWDVEPGNLKTEEASDDLPQDSPTNTCWQCGSKAIEGGQLLHDFDEIRHTVVCLNCGHRWQEIFVFRILESDGEEVRRKKLDNDSTKPNDTI